MNSSTRSAVRDWLFKGLVAENLLDRLEADGLSVRAGEDSRAVQRVLPLEDFSASIRRGAMTALPAYLAFFCLENAIRELVSARMAENHGASWWESKAASALRDKVKRRRDAEGQNRWHIARGADELQYTDFGDLKAIIQSNWAEFEDLFPDQNWLLARLGELEASRNIIAHMNTLDERETSRLRLYLTDWIKQVG
jgi:hypothetical protein